MKFLVAFLFGLGLLPTGAFAQDSLQYLDLVSPGDTLLFDDLYQGLYSERAEVYRNRQMTISELHSGYEILDSMPNFDLYLYGQRLSGSNDFETFLISHQTGEGPKVSGMKLPLPAELQSFKIVQEDPFPVLELEYAERTSAGSTELEISAFFVVDGYAAPVARVIRKLWETRHGNYEPACKDYQYYSIEFSREVKMKRGTLRIGEGKYKHSSNLNCKISNKSLTVTGGVYELKEGRAIRGQ